MRNYIAERGAVMPRGGGAPFHGNRTTNVAELEKAAGSPATN